VIASAPCVKAVVRLYTDGACRGNPGPGGWGALLQHGDRERELYGAEAATTNNRMELRRRSRGSRPARACEVDLATDSTYVMKGMTEWLEAWKRRGWKTAGRKPVANAELWQQLDERRRSGTRPLALGEGAQRRSGQRTRRSSPTAPSTKCSRPGPDKSCRKSKGQASARTGQYGAGQGRQREG
jgi:ribonuclease HI